jgi:hypothetical protein
MSNMMNSRRAVFVEKKRPKLMDAMPTEAAWDSENNLLLKLLKLSNNKWLHDNKVGGTK